MSARHSNAENRNRRIGCWMPSRMFEGSAKAEPTKPSKPGFVGFVGALRAEYPIIRTRSRCTLTAREHRQAVQIGLDCSTKTTRLMSWSEPKTAAVSRGRVMPAKAEA
jgi:hypothetical protein